MKAKHSLSKIAYTEHDQSTQHSKRVCFKTCFHYIQIITSIIIAYRKNCAHDFHLFCCLGPLDYQAIGLVPVGGCWVSTKNWHDDVIKLKHIPHHWPFVRAIHRAPVDFPYKGQWREALMFPLICAWTNGWANNWDAGDLRSHRALYDITVM